MAQPPPLDNVRNIKPRHRNLNNENTIRSKDFLEKKRLKERHFGHIRYESDVIDDPINPIPDKNKSLSYSNDIDRFNVNIIEENLKEKTNKLSKQNLKIQHLTKERIDRDKKRWDSMNLQYESNENKIKNFTPIKNNPSMPYDPITLRYNDSKDGKRLEFQDKNAIYRAKLREKRLFEKQTSGFDPVTGKPKRYTNVIVKPEIPKELKDD